MAGSYWPDFDGVEMQLRVEIMVSAPGLRILLSPEDYPRYQADPMAYVAIEYGTSSQHVRRYLDVGGVIQCMQILSNGKQCRNRHGVHVSPGQLELERWLELDESGWYCSRHAE